MLKYKFYKILRVLHLIPKKKFQKRTAKYTKDYRLLAKSKLFNPKWYLEQNSDVEWAEADPIEHYLNFGWQEGRNPSKKFDGNMYLELNPDVQGAGMNPLLHYERYGRKEGRTLNIVGLSEYKGRVFRIKLVSFMLRILFRKIYSKKIKMAKNSKIAVHLHLFYEPLWREIKEYLKNLNCYDYDLFITYVENISTSTTKDIYNFKPNIKLLKVPNRGFDLGPFIYFLHQIDLKQYDIVFKLHTKRNIVPNNYYGFYMKGSEWRKFLYDGILGVKNVHKTIYDLLSFHKIGMVAQSDMIVSNDLYYNREETIRIMNKFNIPLPQEYKFVMGAIFAAKISLFENIKNAVSIMNFEESCRGFYTTAHSFERILCLNVLAQGFKIKGNSSLYSKRILRKIQAKIHPFNPDLLINKDFCKDYIFYDKTNRSEKKELQICTLLKDKNENLYNALIRKATIKPDEDLPIDSTSFKYLNLLKGLILNREVAKITSKIDSTIFRLVGNSITVEKKVKRKQKCHFLRVYDQPPQFVLSGTYLADIIKKDIERKDLNTLIQKLSPYLEAVFETFQGYDNDKLDKFAWGAIPRNTLIDNFGKYRFFDCNIAYIPGVTKSYFIYRVVWDVWANSREYNCEYTEDQLEKLYNLLCQKFQIVGTYTIEKNNEKSIRAYFMGKETKLQFMKDFISYIALNLHKLKNTHH